MHKRTRVSDLHRQDCHNPYQLVSLLVIRYNIILSNINHFETVLSKMLNKRLGKKKAIIFRRKDETILSYLVEKRKVVFGRKELHPTGSTRL